MTSECRHLIEYWEGDTYGTCQYCGQRFNIMHRKKGGHNA